MKRLIIYLLVLISPVAAEAAGTQLNALSWCRADGTDQTVNMQKAVNAAATAGQSLFVPPGIVYTAASLTNTANVLIEDYTDLGAKTLRGALEIVTAASAATTNYFGGTNVTQLGDGDFYGRDFINKYNVLWWGADKTGTTDSSAKIAAAIAAIHPTGGTLYFPAGTYLISTPITLIENNDLTLLGESSVNSILPLSGAIIKLKDGANCDMLVKQTNARVNIKNLVFNGNKANQTATNINGIWLQGSGGTIARTTVEDVYVSSVSGVGIRNDNRETRMYRIHVGYCEDDGILNTAVSDAIFEDILSGFNAGNGLHYKNANNARINRGDFYRNGLNGFMLENSNDNDATAVRTDANVQNGIYIYCDPGLFSYRNIFTSCYTVKNNYHLDHDGNASAVPDGTYSNLKLSGDLAIDTVFSSCWFWAAQSAIEDTLRPKYQVEDARPYYSGVGQYMSRTTFLGCNFSSLTNHSVLGYAQTNFLKYARVDSHLDGGRITTDNLSLALLNGIDAIVSDELRVGNGFQNNAFYDGAWRYSDTNSAAWYFRTRTDTPLLGLLYAPATNAPATTNELTWSTALTINPTNGYVHIGSVLPGAKLFDIEGAAKANDLEVSAGLMLNAYYSGSWKRRADGHPVLIQPNVAGTTTNTVFYISEYGAADSAITWKPFLTAAPDGGLSAPTNLTLLGTGVQVTFGATNTAPADPVTPTKWISVRVNGEATAYRIPLYE